MATSARRLLTVLKVALLLSVAESRPSDSGAPDGEAWRKYFRNDTLTGSTVPCSPEERFCLQRGLLLHKESGDCYLWGKARPCEEVDEIFRVDKEEFLASGHVLGACVKRKQCSDADAYRMAADGSCLSMSAVGHMCYSQEGVVVAEDLFGATECACAFGSCTVTAPAQPPSAELPEGQCVVPALRETELPSHPYDRTLATARSQVPCTETERRCFLDGRLYFEPRDLCFSLWERGPCAEGEWFAIDREEAVNGTGRLSGVCRAAPCPPGRVPSVATALHSAGSCVTPRQLCAGGYHVAFDAEGLAACAWAPFVSLRMPTERLKADEVCGFPGLGHPGTATDHFYPPSPPPPSACPESKTGFCDREQEE